jgi:hypothetical protein
VIGASRERHPKRRKDVSISNPKPSMSNNLEEQEMEAEALTAIYDSFFHIHENTDDDRKHWSIDIYPETTSSSLLDDRNNSGEGSADDNVNHVAISLHVMLPPNYPDDTIPEIELSIIKGLVDEHAQILLQCGNEEATNNIGVPCVFAIAERIREWLSNNNRKGMDDISMHAQMMRKRLEEEKAMVKYHHCPIYVGCALSVAPYSFVYQGLSATAHDGY